MDTRRNTTEVELLAPAGSAETLRAVIAAGADAVYIGGSRFGARAYADNPPEDALLQAIDHAHLRGARVYLTVNTLLADRELGGLSEYIAPYYRAGLDAVIVQDLGVLSFLTEHFPKLPVHISTQMTVTHADAAALFPENVTRIVPARELSLSEIRNMRLGCGLELEIFVHGALCYCYSGQCLMSSLIGGRSGNRGRCAQPCRKEYTYTEGGVSKRGYLLSLRDQCLLPRLHELLETGIHSLKIEGRMKRTEYAAGVTAIYRKWIDRYYALGPQAYRKYLAEHEAEMRADVETLAELYNRGGFCDGYVFGQKGPSMVYTDRPNHTGVPVGTAVIKPQGKRSVAEITFTKPIGPGEVLEVRSKDNRVLGEWTTPRSTDGYRIPAIPLKEARSSDMSADVFRMKKEPLLEELAAKYVEKKVGLKGMFVAVAGSEMTLSVGAEGEDDYLVTVTGPVPGEAAKAAATEADIRGKLTRTGGTSYEFRDLEIILGDGLFIPASVLNQMRREALVRYEEAYLSRFRRTEPVGSVRRTEKNGDGAAVRPLYSTENAGNTKRVIACVMKKEQAEAAIADRTVTELYIDTEGDYEACLSIPCDKPRRLVLPRAVRGEKRNGVLARFNRIFRENGLAGLVVRTPDQLAYVCAGNIPFETDKTLYCMNSTSVEYLLGKGASSVTLSEELKKEDLPVSGRTVLTVYGRSLSMVSEQCPRRTLGICDKKGGEGVLRDETGERFPTLAVCKYCHGLIYNSHIMSLLPVFGELPEELGGIRLDFTSESRGETEEVLQKLRLAKAGMQVASDSAETKGHFKRGAE